MLQGKLTQRDQVAASKEVLQRGLGPFDGINIAASHARLQCLRGKIRHHNLIGALHHPIRNCLADLDAGDAVNRRRHTFNVLHVHRRQHVDVRFKQRHDVLVSLGVQAPFNVGMGKFIDQHDGRPTSEDRLNIHLLKGDAFILKRLPRHLLQLAGEFRGSRTAVRFNHADHDIFAALTPADRLREHIESFPDTRGIAEEELEGAPGLLGRRDLIQPLLRRTRRPTVRGAACL